MTLFQNHHVKRELRCYMLHNHQGCSWRYTSWVPSSSQAKLGRYAHRKPFVCVWLYVHRQKCHCNVQKKFFFLLSLNDFFFSSRNMQPVRAYGRYPHAVFLVPFQKMYSTSTHSALWPWKVKKYPLQKTKPCSWTSSNHSAKRPRAGRQKIQQVRMYGPYKTSVFPNTSPLSSSLFAGVSW